ncbi:MAG: cytochrome c peroxidase [Verrucomicrobiota bacterium]
MTLFLFGHLEPTRFVYLVLTALAISGAEGEDVPDGLPAAIVDSDFHGNGRQPAGKVELGRQLFFDKILSGNRNISCATCHHPKHGTSDALALSFGEGASGIGPERRPGAALKESVHGRIPRNSPGLFNVGAREFKTFFHDGRVEVDSRGYYDSGFITPAKWKLPGGLDNALAAQAMFPVLSPDEMAGQKGENEIADAVSLNRAAGNGGAWDLLAARLREIPEYGRLFREAYSGEVKQAEDITFVQVANAIAAFQAVAFRADNSPFDRYLRGEETALDEDAKRGMTLFYGEANCASCHGGKLQTDHGFYAIAMPQIGPGKGDGRDGGYWRASGHRGFLEDFGRGRVTRRPEDNFKFRTPSLRNVAITGPWGHSGAYETLRDVVRHHVDPVEKLKRYEAPVGILPELDSVLETTANGSSLAHQRVSDERMESWHLRDTWVSRNDILRERISAANQLEGVGLDDSQIDELVAFLEALTDSSGIDHRVEIPARVPSGLPVDR